ncbi:Isoleucine--tRNA ligase [bioreactor metagenome]|uniref:Isoleucine--tRNA ligase n=1 Tax=bioreactor metagenome TaxID=1076179 RepID=A0A645F1R8_9ZZZZ
MPHREGEDARNVVLNQMADPYADYALSESDMAKWDKVIALRDDVNGVLETARAEKMIGKSLEADVELLASDEEAKAAVAAANGLALNDIIITSAAESVPALSGDAAVKDAGVNFPGLTIGIRKARGNKCSRCWKFDPAVGDDELCPRCKAVVEKLAHK